jgi:hypothetical protein
MTDKRKPQTAGRIFATERKKSTVGHAGSPTRQCKRGVDADEVVDPGGMPSYLGSPNESDLVKQFWYQRFHGGRIAGMQRVTV